MLVAMKNLVCMKITKKTHFAIIVSIVAQTKIIIQQIGVILFKSNFHEIRVIELP